MKVTLGKKKTEDKSDVAGEKAKMQSVTATDKTRNKTANISSGCLREIIEKRQYNSKFYVDSNGSMTAEYHGNTIHYLDPTDNAFKEIDNSLINTGDGFETRSNTFKTRFRKFSKDGKIFELEKNICKIGLISRDAAEKGGCQLESCSCEDVEFKEKSKVILRDIKENVDIEYTVDSAKVKEDIIIKQKAEKYEFNFDLSIENLVVSVSKDGKRLELKKKESGVAQFYIPSPFMTDAAGEYSDSVYYEIVQVTDNLINFKVIADKEWINAEQRLFPVTIDPQILDAEFIYEPYRDDYDYGGYRKVIDCRTYTNGKLSGKELKIYSNSNSQNVIESELVIRKGGINRRILDNVKEVRLKLSIDTNWSKTPSNFIIDNVGYHYWSSDQKYMILDITDSFNAVTGDVLIFFKIYNYLGDRYPQMLFHSPVLEIEYYNNVISIEITAPPLKTKYWAGEKFDPTGMTVKATYENGDVLPILDYSYSPSSLVTLANYDETIKISYEGATASQPIFVEGTFNDRRSKQGDENVYTMLILDDNNNIKEEKRVRLVLADGAAKGDEGTPLTAKNLNNLIVRAENIVGVINKDNLPK